MRDGRIKIVLEVRKQLKSINQKRMKTDGWELNKTAPTCRNIVHVVDFQISLWQVQWLPIFIQKVGDWAADGVDNDI